MTSETQSSQNDTNQLNSMNFTDPNHGNVILESLQALRESKEFCDVVIHVENRKFYLHRNILCTFSTYFESIFQRKLAARETFNVTSQSAEIFEAFVHYMYTGTIVIDKENVEDMLRLANRLEVDKIKSCCAEYLEKNMNSSNCLAVKEMADKYKMPLLSILAVEFVRSHLSEVLPGSEVMGLDVFKLEKFLSNKSFGLTQLQVMQVIVNWTKRDVSKREKQLKPILKFIKWMDIDIQHINDIIENDSLFTTSQMSLYLMLTHLRDNGLTFAQFHSVFDELTEKYSYIQSERETEDVGTITKVKISAKKIEKKKRLLRANPIARLAALKSALLIKSRRNNWLSGVKSGRFSKLKGSEPLLKCHLCDHHANDTTSLEQHLSAIHARDVTYKCGVCGFVCQWNNLYIEHIRKHFPGPPYKCDSCNFTNEKLTCVLTHRSKHVKEKVYRCQQCRFTSKSQTTVLIHSKIHLVLPPPPKPAVKKVDANLGYEKAYACDVCGFITKFLSHLAAHKRIHSGGVYRCSHTHCKFTTGKKAELKTHVKTHEGGPRPHSCKTCGRGFAEKSHLVRHERIHLEDKPFKCTECDYGSSRRDKLKEHEARHLKDMPTGRIRCSITNKKANQEKAKDSTQPTTATTDDPDDPDNVDDDDNVATTNLDTYVTHTTNESQNHPTTIMSTATTTELDYQELNSTKGGVKGDSTSGANPGNTQQSSTPAAIEAAVIIDPRYHSTNSSTGCYTVTAIPVPTIVANTSGQSVQNGHQAAEYSPAIMSLL